MVYLLLKWAITGAVVAGVSEVAKRSTLLASVLVSLPLTSILAMIWLYLDTGDVKQVKDLSVGIFWMVLPSLFFFILFPVLVKLGFRFYSSLGISAVGMVAFYTVYTLGLRYLGVKL